MKIKVISVFRDKFTGKLYNPGDVLDFEDENRVKDLSDRKLAEVVEEKKSAKVITLFEQEFEKKDVVDVLKSLGVPATMGMKEETILSKVVGLEDDAALKLKEALGVE